MGMITGCPACGTLFKVVPDQLKVSDGWVRCGHCSEVFDASARLQDAAQLLDPPQAQPSSAAAQPSVPAFPAPTQAPSPRPVPDWQAPEPEPASDPLPEPRVPTWPHRYGSVGAAPEVSPHDEASLDLDISRPAPLSETAPASVPAVSHPALSTEADDAYLREVEALRSASERAQAEAEAAQAEAPADVSFVRQARRRAFWRRPLVRTLLALLLLALTVLLAVQVSLQQRERLVAQWPQLRDVLQPLCELQGCSIGPWRQIDALVIDSSGFNRLRADTYRLSVVLTNQAPLPVAMPHLELTLTDTQDQALVRRVLTPRDLGASAATLAAGAEWNGAATVAVAVPASVGRIAGYRLIAFYP